jgi:hypothetical protein
MGNTLALKAAILILFSIYIYVAGFSYTALVVNNDFASSVSTYVRIFLLALIFLLMGIQGEVKKIQLYFLVFSAFCIITMNPFLIIVAFMILPGVIFSNFINNKKAINTVIGASILSFFSIFLLSYFDIIDTKILIDDGEFTLSNLRETFGFNNPNAASMYIAQILMIAIVYKSKLLSIILFLFFVWITLATGSRTPFYAVVFFLTLLLFSHFHYFNKIIKIGSILFVAIVPFIIKIYISNGIWHLFGFDFNHILTYRLSIIQNLYHTNGGVNFLPHYSIEFVDSGYANLFLNGGVVFYLLFLVFCCTYVKYENNNYYLSFFCAFLIILISESFITGNLIFSILIVARYIYLLNFRFFGKLSDA